MNIGLMFVHEPIETDRQAKQRETDKIIEEKLGSSNIITNFIAYITGTIGGPIVSFFKKNGFAIAVGILSFVFLFKIGEAFLGRMSIVFYKEIGFSKGQIAKFIAIGPISVPIALSPSNFAVVGDSFKVFIFGLGL